MLDLIISIQYRIKDYGENQGTLEKSMVTPETKKSDKEAGVGGVGLNTGMLAILGISLTNAYLHLLPVLLPSCLSLLLTPLPIVSILCSRKIVLLCRLVESGYVNIVTACLKMLSCLDSALSGDPLSGRCCCLKPSSCRSSLLALCVKQ